MFGSQEDGDAVMTMPYICTALPDASRAFTVTILCPVLRAGVKCLIWGPVPLPALLRMHEVVSTLSLTIPFSTVGILMVGIPDRGTM